MPRTASDSVSLRFPSDGSGVVALSKGVKDRLTLGNIDARRDWGHAQDYVRAIFLMMQQNKFDDFVISTGIEHSVRDLISIAFDEVGLTGKESEFLEIDEKLLRSNEISGLVGDASKAKKILGWEPETPFEEVFRSMVRHDMELRNS